MEQNKTGKYLKYAIGEVVLVVIGILIALSINNWNQERKQTEKLNVIYSRNLHDIQNNLNDVIRIMDSHKSKEYLFRKVMTDSLNKEDITNGWGAHLITYYEDLSLDKSGVDGLKIINVNDSLSIKIIKLYDYYSKMLEVSDATVRANIQEALKHWRDNYSWFPQFILGNVNQEAMDYFLKSQNYKNLITYHFTMIYLGYLPTLEEYQEDFTQIKKELERRLKL